MYAGLSAEQSTEQALSVVRHDLVVADENGPVLVTAGDADIRRRICSVLLEHGFVVVEAADAETALELARHHPVEVAVVDVNDSGIAPPEFLRRWQEEHPGQYLPVLMLASRAAPADVRAGIHLGAHDYLLPPYEDVEVLARVHSALGVKRHHDDLRRRMDELQLLVRTDAVTGLYNRRHMEAELTTLVSAARRQGRPLGVLLVDVDRFKRVNDRVSHDAGDTALRVIAHRIRSTSRAEDRVGRWGGDEFVVLLPSTDQESAVNIAQRLRRDVAKTTIGAVAGVSLTVSVGCAAAFDPEEAALIGAADAALHRAKAHGRNRVAV